MKTKPAFRGAVSTLSLCIVSAVAMPAASVPAESCMQSALSPETIDLLLQDYKSDPDRRDRIIKAITDTALKQGHIKYAAGREADATERVRTAVKWSLDEATDSGVFNEKLAGHVASSCEEINRPPAKAENAAARTTPAAAAAAKPSDAAAGATASTSGDSQKTTIPQSANAAKGQTGEAADTELESTDTLSKAGDKYLEAARQQYYGQKTPMKESKSRIGKLLAYHGVMLECPDKCEQPPRCDKESCDSKRCSAEQCKATKREQQDAGTQAPLQLCQRWKKGKTHSYPDECLLTDEIETEECAGLRHNTAKCSRQIFSAIDKIDSKIGANLDAAKAVKSADAGEIEDLKKKSAQKRKDALEDEGVRSSYWGLYAGPNFTLQDDGSWEDGVEIATTFYTEVFDRGHCPWAKTCRGFVDVSFVTPDAFPKETENADELPVGLFDSKGRARVSAGFQWHWNSFWGVEVGGGVTSPISDDTGTVRAEPRAHIGAHFQTVFSDRVAGQFMLGYARDQAWERLVDEDGDLTTTADQRSEHRFDRLLLEGKILFPQVDIAGVSLAARISADVPWSGDTQSEVRASILFYYPFIKALDKFRPSVKAAAETPAP